MGLALIFPDDPLLIECLLNYGPTLKSSLMFKWNTLLLKTYRTTLNVILLDFLFPFRLLFSFILKYSIDCN